MSRWPSPVVRFWIMVDKNGPIQTHCPELGPCWRWKGSNKREGYGRFHIAGRLVAVHRFSWELANGRIPEGKSVLHKCDNPECTNPCHLFLGTHRDNMDDMLRKNRQRSSVGELNSRVKLKEADVKKIRELVAVGGMTHREIAEKFGVQRPAISAIVQGRHWAHI